MGRRDDTNQTVAAWIVEDVEKPVDEPRRKGVEFEQYNLARLRNDERDKGGTNDGSNNRERW